MFRFFQRIWRGAGYLEGYGHHPGTEMFLFMVVACGLAGVGRGGWAGFIGGSLFGFVMLGIPYAYGCYGRTKSYERDIERTVKLLQKDYK